VRLALRPRHAAAPAALILLAAGLGAASSAQAAEQIVEKAYTTGYTWYDNTPAGSAAIARPVIHQVAAGTGTYADPITLAVGIGSDKQWDYPAGTRFYIPNLRRYFIAEDQCGATANDPCHSLRLAPSGATTWLDLWMDGETTSDAAITACTNKITDLHRVVVNPSSGYAVASGKGIYHDGNCDTGYGDALVPASGSTTTTTATKAPTTTATTTTATKAPTSTATSTAASTAAATPASKTRAAMLTSLTSGAGYRWDDDLAPTGDHVVLQKAGSNSGTIRGSGALTVWAKADVCSGSPQMTVTVDGKSAAFTVSRTSGFDAFVTPFAVASGSHSVSVAFTNDYYTGPSCDRNLHVGGVAFGG